MAKNNMASDTLVVQNAAKTLLANIRFAGVDRTVTSIVVTSAVPNEGKSTVAYNLAQAAASSGKRTLLVACDMRRRSLATMMGVHARHGIYAVLSGQVELEDAKIATPHRNLFFLDCEPQIPNPADILSSRRFRHLLDDMENDYDYVIIDTPPVGTFVDAAIVGALADATVLVVRENFVKREELKNAYDQLRKANAHVIGAIMNRCVAESGENYYAYYNQYGRNDGTNAASEDGPQMPEKPANVLDAEEECPASKPDTTGAERHLHLNKKPSPSETASFTAAAAASAAAKPVQPLNVRRNSSQAGPNRFKR